MNFYVRAVWDEESKVFYSESDITGLHIEAKTLAEFQKIMQENASDLVLANHVKPQQLVKQRLSDLIPTIFWEQGPSGQAAA